MDEQFFSYRFDDRWKPMFKILGVDRDDGVTVGVDGSLVATYGRASVRTHVDNVDHTEISGPHRWYTAVGLRLSFTDDGLTFGTTHERGLCVAFVDPVDRVIGFRPHSAIWVSVADPEALASAIEEAR
jgi:hypothetical protein